MKHQTDYIERLANVVRVLNSVPKAKRVSIDPFKMNRWTSHCGTCACAIGWAGQDKWFTKRGLRIRGARTGWAVPTFRNYEGINAVASFMGMTYPEAKHLFMPDSYARGNKGDVTNRIRSAVFGYLADLPPSVANIKRSARIVNLMAA